ncbi:MAG: TrkH family potassium uptake protein [Flavobacteriaceae bacterium]
MSVLSSTERAPRGFIDIRPALSVAGLLLTLLGTSMLLPAMIDLYFGNRDWVVFAGSGLMTVFVGVTMWVTCQGKAQAISLRQAFVMTSLSWIALVAFGALPYAWSVLGMSYTDAFFESMSGLTTTGATVINGLDFAPPGLLFWRALQQWLGGLGIIVMAVAVLPMLQIGGMQMFKTEAFETPDKILPRAAQISGMLSLVYAGLTGACALLYGFAGMRVFDAVTHAMTTVATGGFANHDASFGHFDSATIEMIAIAFMILGSLPFLLFVRMLHGDFREMFRDAQVRAFIGILAALIGLLTARLLFNGVELGLAARDAAFNVVSIMTGTGYATKGYDLWGPFSISIFFFATFLGGCAGSTSCGMKTFRIIVVWEDLKQHVRRIVYPSAVSIKRYNGLPLPDNVSAAVQSFVFMFLACFAALALALSLCGLDTLSAISGAATAISNVGPGLGELIGPSTTFAGLSDTAKWILSIGMLVGRLELFTILILFVPAFWR